MISEVEFMDNDWEHENDGGDLESSNSWSPCQSLEAEFTLWNALRYIYIYLMCILFCIFMSVCVYIYIYIILKVYLNKISILFLSISSYKCQLSLNFLICHCYS